MGGGGGIRDPTMQALSKKLRLHSVGNGESLKGFSRRVYISVSHFHSVMEVALEILQIHPPPPLL